MRVVIACVVLSLGTIVSAHLVLNNSAPDRATADTAAAGPSTLALAPISLGNPAAAATLRTRGPGFPGGPGAGGAPYRYIVRAERGDTLAGLLIEAGIDPDEAGSAIKALRPLYDPRRIRPGQKITLTFRPDPGGLSPGRFLGLSLEPVFTTTLTVARTQGGGFRAAKTKRPLVKSQGFASGTIERSLFVAATRAKMPLPVLTELIRAYSWDVDFQRDIRPGDRFEVLFERFDDAEGTTVHYGDIVYAALSLSGTRHALYRYTTTDGTTDYFDEGGLSARKALLRTPVDGARLTSGYGRRRHPILGYTKMHRGVDFAAPAGTPIYAAGDGTVERAGRNGAYGKYVRIRHNRDYATAYAHMSRLARGLRRGRRVKQGDIIGYVGSTGRSTGPHLHYEILRGGRQTNPLKVKMPSGRRLAGKELARFEASRGAIDQRVAALDLDIRFASSDGSEE